ncbi:MAG: hypothetical protein COA43_02080 [Robiginitomaculum sp.]|nr:MAG: hypothetical protein COA43_02080 [Robiginitomaculum sp.]
MVRVTLLNLKKYSALFFAFFFLALQGAGFAHSIEFDFGRHSHDGISCSILHNHEDHDDEDRDDEDNGIDENNGALPSPTIPPILTVPFSTVHYEPRQQLYQNFTSLNCTHARAPPLP